LGFVDGRQFAAIVHGAFRQRLQFLSLQFHRWMVPGTAVHQCRNGRGPRGPAGPPTKTAHTFTPIKDTFDISRPAADGVSRGANPRDSLFRPGTSGHFPSLAPAFHKDQDSLPRGTRQKTGWEFFRVQDVPVWDNPRGAAQSGRPDSRCQRDF